MEKNEKQKKIEYCKANNKVVSLFYDSEDQDYHLTGYVECYDDEEILIRHISKNGYNDGFVLKRLSDIWRVRYDGAYEERTKILYAYRKQHHPDFKQQEKSILLSALIWAKQNDYVVTVETEEYAFSGIVQLYDEQYITVREIDDYGIEGALTVIELDTLIGLIVNGEEEQVLHILYESHK